MFFDFLKQSKLARIVIGVIDGICTTMLTVLSDRVGFKGGQTGQLPRPPQLGGLHKNSKKTYLGNIKILFETDNLE